VLYKYQEVVDTYINKSVKMPKSESVKQRRTDNTMAKRNKEGQTIQWPKETKKDRQYNGMAKRNKEGQTIQWPKETKKDRQYNGQKKQRKTDNSMAKRNKDIKKINNLPNTTQKT